MLMTNQTTIQEVLLFPQMKLEKTQKKDSVSKYTALEISEEWVPAIQKAGYLTIEDLSEANAGKLHQELCGLNKKYKLELQNPTGDVVSTWIANAQNSLK